MKRYKALPGTSKRDSRSSDVGCEHVNVGVHDQQQMGRLCVVLCKWLL